MIQVWVQIARAFPGGSDGKASVYNAGDLGSIPGLGRSPGEGNGNPLQDNCLENPMDRGAWKATAHGIAKSRTRLSDFTSLHRLLEAHGCQRVQENVQPLEAVETESDSQEHRSVLQTVGHRCLRRMQRWCDEHGSLNGQWAFLSFLLGTWNPI